MSDQTMTATKVMRGRPRKNPNQTENIGYSASEADHGHSHEDEAPKKRRGRQPGSGKGAVGTDEQLERIEGMLLAYATMTCGILAKLSPKDAVVVAQHTLVKHETTPNLIGATMDLARYDRKVRAYLFGMAAQSAYLNVAVAAASMALGIMANHGLLPPMFNPANASPKEAQNNGVSSVA